MTSRQDRIQHLTRVNRRRVSEPAAARELAKVLQLGIESAELESVEQTDKHWEIYQRGYAEVAANDPHRTLRHFFNAECQHAVRPLTNTLAGQITGESAYLILHFAGDFFSVKVDAGHALTLLEKILALDRDTFCLISADLTQGILIDRNPDDQVETYEVAVWGDRWKLGPLAAEDPHKKARC